MNDPNGTQHVFTLIEALPGRAPAHMAAGFLASDDGMRLLRDKPDILPLLRDREWLRSLPEDSLGRTYLAFMESEAITADGLVEASAKATVVHDDDDPNANYIRCRMRDTHDLWHAATGYGPDVLGEFGLLAFNLAQTHHLGIGLILVMGIVTRRFSGALDLARDGFRRGRRAAFLPAQPWEELLPLPLSTVRARLGLEGAPTYERLYAQDLPPVAA
jgi:ubiquinone biosynthesis protein COQ4